MKITNLEDRLKSEMTGAGAALPGDMNTTAEALRLAAEPAHAQPRERR